MAFILTTLFTIQLSAQSQNAVFQAYMTGDVDVFAEEIAQQQQQFTTSQDAADQLALAKLQYAAFAAFQKTKDEDGAQNTVNAAEKNAKAVLKANPKSAEANALLSGIYGLQIGLSPMKGMTLGSKSSNLINKALKIDADNAFANYQKGSSLYYTPRLWGGNVPKSIEHLNKAKASYEANDMQENWEYLAVLATLGQAYHYQENFEQAKSTYELALEVAPDYGWVKYQLYPNLKKDME